LDDLDITTLKEIQALHVDVHIIMISPSNSNNFVNMDTANVGIPIEIIGKPIRNSLLLQHLHRKKRRASMTAQTIGAVQVHMNINFHTLNSADSSGDNPRDSAEFSSGESPMIDKSATKTTAHVLLVEDNVTNQKVLQMLLKRIGNIELTLATNGQEAVDSYETKTFDLILMDCQMPVMDGYSATIEIRKMESAKGLSIGTSRIPIIALTANAMEADREKCLKIGMDDYLTKPIILETLRKKLEYWLDASRSQKSEFKNHSSDESVVSQTTPTHSSSTEYEDAM